MKKFVALFIFFSFVFAILNVVINNAKEEKQESLLLNEQLIEKEIQNKNANDKVKPTISLKNKKITISTGAQIDYLSLISSATDNLDGDIIKNIVYNTIDTTIPGNYTITYRVKDSAGNEAKVELAVHVVKDHQLAK